MTTALKKPQSDVERMFDRLIIVGESLLKEPTATSQDELIELSRKWHEWRLMSEKTMRESFEPPTHLKYLKELAPKHLQFSNSWQKRAKAYSDDIRQELEFLENLYGRLGNFKQLQSDRSNNLSQPEGANDTILEVQHLHDEELRQISRLLLEAHIDTHEKIDDLILYITPSYRRNLPTATENAPIRLRKIIDILNSTARLKNGQLPLEVFLSNAVFTLGHSTQSIELAEMLEDIRNKENSG